MQLASSLVEHAFVLLNYMHVLLLVPLLQQLESFELLSFVVLLAVSQIGQLLVELDRASLREEQWLLGFRTVTGLTRLLCLLSWLEHLNRVHRAQNERLLLAVEIWSDRRFQQLLCRREVLGELLIPHHFIYFQLLLKFLDVLDLLLYLLF